MALFEGLEIKMCMCYITFTQPATQVYVTNVTMEVSGRGSGRGDVEEICRVNF